MDAYRFIYSAVYNITCNSNRIVKHISITIVFLFLTMRHTANMIRGNHIIRVHAHIRIFFTRRNRTNVNGVSPFYYAISSPRFIYTLRNSFISFEEAVVSQKFITVLHHNFREDFEASRKISTFLFEFMKLLLTCLLTDHVL